MTQVCRKQHDAIESITVLLNVLHPRASGTLGGCGFCLPMTLFTLGAWKKKRSIKGLDNTVALADTSSADIATTSAHKNSRRVWYYIG